MPRNLPITGNRAECPTCRECFNSDSAFDRHRAGTYDDPTPPPPVSDSAADGRQGLHHEPEGVLDSV